MLPTWLYPVGSSILLAIFISAVTACRSVQPATVTPTVAAAKTEPAQRHQEEQTMKLIDAASRGDLAAVEQLVAQGADLHARDSRGQTALIAAAYGNQLAVTETLIK